MGLVIVGFYGADTWWGTSAEANKEMKTIAEAVGAGDHIYRSLDIWDPYQYLLNYFHSEPNCGNNSKPIKIFGHSWGGISAVKLALWVGRSDLRSHEVDVYTIDPVSILRLPPISIPSNVTKFWNRYESHGNGVAIFGFNIHGRSLPPLGRYPDQVDLNPDGKQKTTAYDGTPETIDHWTIIWDVENELVNLLGQ